MKRNVPLMIIILACFQYVHCQIDWDKHIKTVRALPSLNGENLNHIITLIRQEAVNDKEFATLVACWIHDNISYDLESFEKNLGRGVEINEILDSRMAICSGYAELYCYMLTTGGIDCWVVNGIGLTSRDEYPQQFDKINHAWNVLKINEGFMLADITWFSGYYVEHESEMYYVKSINPDYLFSKPETFKKDHYPVLKFWQLSNYPISIDDFSNCHIASNAEQVNTIKYSYKDSISSYLKLEEQGKEDIYLTHLYNISKDLNWLTILADELYTNALNSIIGWEHRQQLDFGYKWLGRARDLYLEFSAEEYKLKARECEYWRKAIEKEWKKFDLKDGG